MKYLKFFEKFNIQNAYNNQQKEDLENMYKTAEQSGYTIDITGDATKGDEIAFVEAVFTGSYPRSRFSHFDLIYGTIIKDSYGANKQQHTFTIETDDGEIRRKGRNVYKYLTLAKPRDKEERQISLDDKHERGQKARKDRKERIEQKQNIFGNNDYDEN